MEFDLEAGEEKDLGTLVLHPVEPIRGRVFDVDGQPRSGVAVCLRESDWAGGFPTTATGPDGRFALHWPASSDAVIEVRDRGGEVIAAIRRGSDAEKRDHEIRLPGLGEVVARLPDPPVLVRSDSRVRITRSDGVEFEPNRPELAGPDGRLAGFRLVPLPAGTYVVHYDGLAVDGSPYVAEAEATVRPGKSEVVELRRTR